MTRPDAAAISTLRAVLRAEIEGHRALLDLLKQEQDALRVGQADAVASLAAVKVKHVDELEGLARQRTELLVNCGMAMTATGPQADALPERVAAAVRADWDVLRGVAAEAQRCNQLNGELIARHQRHVAGALSSLLQGSGRASVYSADGRPQPLAIGRSLGST